METVKSAELLDSLDSVEPFEPFEFLANNCELRSFFRFFLQRRDCSGIRWVVAAGIDVTAGQVIGELLFATGGPVQIVAPIDAVVMRVFDPDVAELPFQPSVPIALFHAKRGIPRVASTPPGGMPATS